MTAATPLPPTPLAAATPAAGQQGAFKARARDAAEDFEAVFLNTFIEQMFAGVRTDGPFGGGQSEATYRSFLTQEYAKQIAKGGGIGLADQIYAEMLKMQEAASK